MSTELLEAVDPIDLVNNGKIEVEWMLLEVMLMLYYIFLLTLIALTEWRAGGDS